MVVAECHCSTPRLSNYLLSVIIRMLKSLTCDIVEVADCDVVDVPEDNLCAEETRIFILISQDFHMIIGTAAQPCTFLRVYIFCLHIPLPRRTKPA